MVRNQKSNRNGVRTFFWAVTILVLLAVFVQIVMLGVFSILGYRCFAVESGSMEPTYPVGSLLCVEKVEENQLEEGMVLTFHSPDNPKQTFTHRAVSIDLQNRLVYTKGDNNPINDPEPTSMDYMVGSVAYSFPYVGFLYLFSHSTTGVVILGLVVILWLSFELERHFDRKKGKQS